MSYFVKNHQHHAYDLTKLERGECSLSVRLRSRALFYFCSFIQKGGMSEWILSRLKTDQQLNLYY